VRVRHNLSFHIPSRETEERKATSAPRKDKQAATAGKKAMKKAEKIVLKEDKECFRFSQGGKRFYRSLAQFLPELKKVEVQYAFCCNKYKLTCGAMENDRQLLEMWLTCGFDDQVKLLHRYSDRRLLTRCYCGLCRANPPPNEDGASIW
jgi:hypothetical protein